jgi:hypothetical protein
MNIKILKNIVPDFLKKWIKRFQNEAFVSGHYYSVIPSLKHIKKNENSIYRINDSIDAISLNQSTQLQLLSKFETLAKAQSFNFKDTSRRFNIDNNSFSYDDAPILHYMLRHIKPRRVIEIGSGNSSAVMLDTQDIFFKNNPIEFTFIDIDLDNLRTVLLKQDSEAVQLIEKPIQSVDLAIFDCLEKNDLFFVDSSHVSKIGSDLHTILFEILPRLKSGVYIHFHDIRFPFQYQKALTYQKIFWNEAYLLRAFLMYNNDFEIIFWLNYLVNSKLRDKKKLDFLPLKLWDAKFNNNQNDFSGAGGSIYLQKK